MIPLIDTHQHLLYPDRFGYAWTNEIPQLAGRTFSLDDYKSLTKGKGIGGTIFMEAGVDDGHEEEEASFVAKVARNDESGIIGSIASIRPEIDHGFEEQLERSAALGVVGYRRILHVVPDDLSTSDTFRSNVRKIGSAGLVFDMCFLSRQLPIAVELARACENVVLVLNHCGVPDIAGGGLDPWRENISKLAAMDHVRCKLSGILAYCSAGEATYEAVKPFVDHVMDNFGPSRIVWGSDWPVVNLANGIGDWIEVTRHVLSRLSRDEAESIAFKTAQATYGVKP